jgi:hypothetical protein
MKHKVQSATHPTTTNWAAVGDWIACLTVWGVGIAMFLAIVCVSFSVQLNRSGL